MDRLEELVGQFNVHAKEDREDFNEVRIRLTMNENSMGKLDARLTMLMKILGALGLLIGGPIVAFVFKHW